MEVWEILSSQMVNVWQQPAEDKAWQLSTWSKPVSLCEWEHTGSMIGGGVISN